MLNNFGDKMAFPLTQLLVESHSSEVSHETEGKILIGFLKIGNEKHKIYEGITKIGREPTCEISLQSTTVSRIHSEIEANTKNVFICNLNSSNKTQLNDVTLRSNRFYEISDGCTLKFGIIEGTFSLITSKNDILPTPTDDSERNLTSINESFMDNDDVSRIEMKKIKCPNSRIIQKKSSDSLSNDIQHIKMPLQSNKNIQKIRMKHLAIELSKKSSSESKINVQELETQVNEQNNISDMETQFSDSEWTNGNSKQHIEIVKSQRFKCKKYIQTNSELAHPLSTPRIRIQDHETQLNTSNEEDIWNLGTQICEMKMNINSVGNIEESVMERNMDWERQLEDRAAIQELNTQFFESDALENSINLDNVSDGSDSTTGAPNISLEVPKDTVENDPNSNDSCSAITQLIIRPKLDKNHDESKKITREQTPSIQMISLLRDLKKYAPDASNNATSNDIEAMKKNHFQKLQISGDEENSIISESEPIEDRQCRLNSENDNIPNSQGNDTDEDMQPTQKIELPKKFQSQILSKPLPLIVVSDFSLNQVKKFSIKKSSPNQFYNECTIQTQLLNNDSIKKNDDLDDTQIIEIAPTKIPTESPSTCKIVQNQSKLHINEFSNDQVRNISLSTVVTPRMKLKNFVNGTSVKGLHSEDNSTGIIASTSSLSSSLIKRTTFNLFLKQKKLTRSERNTHYNTQILSSKKTIVEGQENNVDNSDNLIGKNLNQISDGSQKAKIDPTVILMTKKLIENHVPVQLVSSSKDKEKSKITHCQSIDRSELMNMRKEKKIPTTKPYTTEVDCGKMREIIPESSDDEDMDYKKLSAMADRYIASSEVGNTSLDNKKIQDSDKKTLNDNNEKIVKKNPIREESNSNKNLTSHQTIKMIEKEKSKASINEVQPNETASFQDNKMIERIKRKRKFQQDTVGGSCSSIDETEITGNKKLRKKSSNESIVGIESQEIQTILKGTEKNMIPQGKIREDQDIEKLKKRNGKLKIENATILNGVAKSSPKTNKAERHSAKSDKVVYCVMFTGIEDEYKTVSNSVLTLGGTVTTNPLEATILVTDRIRRTFKFFCAISRSIFIVSIDWVKDSMESACFLDPKKYFLRDSIAESKFKFSLHQSLSRAKAKKLLEGYTVLLTPKIVGPCISDLEILIQASGGKPLVRAPRSLTENAIIISCEKDLPYVKRIISRINSTNNVPIVSVEFLLSGILRQQLEFQEFSIPM